MIEDAGLLERSHLSHSFFAVNGEEFFVFFVFEGVEFVEVFVFEAVFVGELAGLCEGFFDEGSGGGRFLGDYAVFAENVVPGMSVSIVVVGWEGLK